MKRKTNGYRVENAKRYTYRQFIHFCFGGKNHSLSQKNLVMEWIKTKIFITNKWWSFEIKCNILTFHMSTNKIHTLNVVFCKHIHNYEQISHVDLLTKCHSCIGIRFECAKICTETLCAIIVMAKRLNAITKCSKILHDSTEKLSSTGCDFFD